MKIITVANIKGGTSKSTTAIHLALALSKKGSTLAIDMDPQADLSDFFFPEEPVEFFDSGNTLSVLNAETTLAESIKKSNNVDVLPSIIELSDLSYLASKDFSIIPRLKNVLSKTKYDYVVIDTPGSGSSENITSYLPASVILVPVTPSKWAVRTVAQVLKKVNEAERFDEQSKKKSVMILPSQWGTSQKQMDLLDKLRNIKSLKILEPIPKNDSIRDRTETGKPLQEGSAPWKAFENLAEILK
ncbi:MULTISPECIES: ParA family protein [Leptospira]|uniref:ParA family protein n=2 Tax=Leptospira TaxID=171 RepID=A0ABY2MXE7_9LEPT|nr:MULTISPECIES: ParA family protein [Leptospira]TGL77242.1 ParA family protein [Leptospira jelokensis]TGM03205.1 ParA family protein [Leptospira jelokensis]TGM10989.1 ParA family protein [Leptospira selangorensis]